MVRHVLDIKHYTDPGTFDQEQRELFGKLWLFAGFSSMVARRNQFFTRRLAGVPVLVQRTEAGVRAFINQCPHRKSAIQTACSGTRPLVCPYHAWTFGPEGELRYKGQALRVDGAPAQHVLPSSVPTLQGGSFGQALVASLAATYYNPWKFERFARTVLGDNYEQQHQQLRAEFKVSLDNFLAVAWNDTHRGLYPTLEGPGRTDAFGRIANASFGDAITPDNYRVANAPVDYPHLWDMWTFDWVQWNASAKQPMARS